MTRRMKTGIGFGAFVLLAMFLGGPALAVVVVDMNFDGPTGLENTGVGPDGMLMNGASIVSGELVTDGSNEPEPAGSGLNLDIGAFGVFSGLGDFTVEFDFASVGESTGALFSADGAQYLDDQGIEFPGEDDGDQTFGLNVFFNADEVLADLWFFDAVGVAGNFNDNAFHHVEVFYNAAETELRLSVDDLEPQFLFVENDDGDGFSRDTSNDITRLGDETNPDFGFEFNEGFNGRFDNLLIDGPAPPPVKLIVDRTTGDLSLEVLGDASLDELSITSNAGTLVPENYDGLAASGGDFADWSVSSSDASEIIEGGSTGALTQGQDFALGNGVWTPFYDEDLRIAINDTDLGESVPGITEFVNGEPLLFGDLDLNGEVDTADWVLFVDGYGSDLEGLTPFESYFLADLNADFEHNAEDFTEFVGAFDEFNGEGAFAAMIGGVPEPGTLALFGVVLAGLAVMGRRRISPLIGRSLTLLVVATAMMALVAPTAQADLLAQYLFETAFEDTSGNNRTGIPQTPPIFAQPTVSDGRIQMTGTTLEYMEIPLGAANPFDGSQNFAVQLLFNSTGNLEQGNPTGVVLFGSAQLAPADWAAEHPMSIFVEPQFEEEVEPGVFEMVGGALVYDNFFVDEVRTPDLLLLDGFDHTVTVVYVAPADLGDPEEPGRVFLQVDDEWFARGDIAPNIPDIATNIVALGSTLNEDYPFECAEGECYNKEFKGSMDNVNIWDGQDAADLAPSELRATVNVNDRTIELVGGEFAEEIKFYEILSENASLNPDGWVHGNLDAQGIGEGEGVGENWDTLDGTEGRLAEGYLSDATLTEDGTVLTLINAYNPYADGVAENDGVDELLTITIVDADLATRELAIEFVGDFCAFSADFDCDGDVDGNDFLAWQEGFGAFDGDAQRANGDADGNGIVDGDDFLIWQAQFGSVEGGASAVPEPSGMLLTLCAVLGFWPTAVRRRSA